MAGPMACHKRSGRVFFSLLVLGFAMAQRFEAPPDHARVVEGEYIVLFKEEEQEPQGRAAGIARKYGLERVDEGWTLIKGFAFR